ncbi:MAG: hypothetical protein PVF48_14565, partial [Syntrophobacterales bacterium]
GKMRRHYQVFAVVVLILFVVSCAPKYMVQQEPLQKPSEGKAIVHFLRPSSFGGALQVTVWDNDKLIGITTGKMGFQYECDPGKHLFISWSEYKSPVEAELLPGRVYYIVLRMRMGWWRGRIHQVPVNQYHELWSDALTWQKTLPNYVPDPAAIAAVEAKNHPKMIKYLQKYHTEIAGTKYVHYLRPEDGVVME